MLHGVCIHEGSADSGHYYSYIKDHESGNWRKFNDHKVDIVAEEDVMEDANGGSARSAYWLVYTNYNRLQGDILKPINKYESSETEQNINTHPYARLVSEEVKHQITEDNKALTAQVLDFKSTELSKKIMARYQNYHKDISTILETP